jgi:hypothetical protein
MVVLLLELEFRDKVIREVVVLPVAQDQLTLVVVVAVVLVRLVQQVLQLTAVAEVLEDKVSSLVVLHIMPVVVVVLRANSQQRSASED